jgi:hypothetical protein
MRGGSLEFLGGKLYYVVEDIKADNSSPGSSNFFHNFSNYLVHLVGLQWAGRGKKKMYFLGWERQEKNVFFKK